MLVPVRVPLVPLEVDPETPAPVVTFRLPAAALPSLLGLPLRLVAVFELLLPEAAGEAFESERAPNDPSVHVSLLNLLAQFASGRAATQTPDYRFARIFAVVINCPVCRVECSAA